MFTGVDRDNPKGADGALCPFPHIYTRKSFISGHTSHEWTSPSAFADIKRFLQERYDALIPSTTSGDASKECSQDDMETENTANLASLESEISTPEKADVSNTDPISKVDDGGTPKATIEIGNGPDQKSDHDGNNGYVAEIGAQKTEL